MYKVVLAAAIISLFIIPYAFLTAGVGAGIISLIVCLALAFIADRMHKKLPPPAQKRTDRQIAEE